MTGNGPILFATDGSPSAAEAQREAFDLAKTLDAHLLLVSVEHVVLPAVGSTAYGYSQVVAELSKAEHKRVEALLAEIEAEAKQEGIRCSSTLAEGFAVEEICAIATARTARLIVVGSHGWGAARRLLSGSVSTGLVHSAPCPVLVVRRDAHAQVRAAA